MAAEDIRKYINLFVDGRGYAGKLEEFNPPKLTTKAEEFKGGGDTPIDIPMGMEKLAADFTLISYDRHVLALWGVAEGQEVSFVMRESMESHDGTKTPVVHTMRGRILALDPGTSKAGDKPALKADLTLTYYKLQHGALTLHEIDALNMVRIVNGVDVLAEHRRNLGL